MLAVINLSQITTVLCVVAGADCISAASDFS